MGLDTCYLIVTLNDVPIEIHVFEKGITRRELNNLSEYVGNINILESLHHQRIYEVSGRISQIEDDKDIIVNPHSVHRIKRIFGQFLDNVGAEEAFAKNPRAGMPIPTVKPGYRLFMFFEG